MKHFRFSLLIWVCVGVAMLGGCVAGKDPETRLAQYRDSFTTVRNAMRVAHQNGAVSDRAYLDFVDADTRVREFMAALEADASVGRAPSDSDWAALEAERLRFQSLPPAKPLKAGIDITVGGVIALITLLQQIRANAQRAGRETLTAEEIAQIKENEAYSVLLQDAEAAIARKRVADGSD